MLWILNTLSSGRKRCHARILVDSTDITLCLNWIRKKNQKKLKNMEFKWAYSSYRKYYIGFKITMAADYPIIRPLTFLLHSGSPHDSRLFEPIMEELQRNSIIHKGDIKIFDKGYYRYRNYQLMIFLYRIVPLIFPHSNASINRILDRISYPITSYKGGKIPEETRRFFQRIETEFVHKVQRWREYKPTRSLIDDFFKLKKDGLSMDCLHRHTIRSVHKHPYRCIFSRDARIIGLQHKRKATKACRIMKNIAPYKN